jgi:hypothetical protein
MDHELLILGHCYLVTLVTPPSFWRGLNYSPSLLQLTLFFPAAAAASLRKVRSDNTRYFGWGNWESFEDLKDHMKTE